MTEAEWLSSVDCDRMLAFLQTRTVSDRKARLFACACCRNIWDILTDESSRKAVEAAELFADGRIRDRERALARNAPGVWVEAKLAAARNGNVIHQADRCALYVRISVANAWSQKCHREGDHAGATTAHYAGIASEEAAQSALAREVFGNPFRVPVISSAVLAWNDGTVPKLAEAIYEERAFDRMPILADALEDAGCTD